MTMLMGVRAEDTIRYATARYGLSISGCDFPRLSVGKCAI